MSQLLNFESGQIENIPDDQVGQALSTGAYGTKKGERFNIISDSGEVSSVGGSDLLAAFGRGYRLESEDERLGRKAEERFGEVGSAALAGAAGAARGLSFGLSDLALTGTGLVEKETLKGLKESSPTASTVGELGAVGASLLVPGGAFAAAGRAGAAARAATGGVRAAARISGAAERGVTGLLTREGAGLAERALVRGLSSAAAGATEGAIYGAGQIVSEAALGDPSEVAEHAIASIGVSALLGGVAGGALGSLGELARTGAGKAVEKIGPLLARTSLRKITGEVAEESAVKALGARGTDLRKLGSEEKLHQVGRDLLDFTFDDGTKLIKAGRKAEDFADDVKRALDVKGSELKALRKQVDDFTKDAPELLPDVGAYLKRVDDEVIAPLRESTVPSVRATAGKVERELSGLTKRWFGQVRDEATGQILPRKPVTLAELEKVRQDLAKVVYPKAPKGGGLPAQPPPHAAELQKAERMLETYVEELTDQAVAKMDPTIAGKYQETKRVVSSLIKADKIVDKARLQDLGNRSISLTDYITAGAAGATAGGPVGLATGLATSVAHKAIRERGRSTVAVIADKLSRMGALENAVQRTRLRVSNAIDSLIARGGGQATAAAIGVTAAHHPELPSKTPTMIDVDFGGGGGGDGGKPRGKRTVYRSTRKQIAQLATNPQLLTDRLAANTAEISDVAPRIAAAMNVKASQIAQYLHDKSPKSPASLSDGVLLPRRDGDWEPSDIQLAQFEVRLAVAESPLSVLENMDKGTLTQEAVDTLRDLYPALHGQITTTLLSRVAELEHTLPYRDRVQLSILFGIPADATMRPDFVASLQAGMSGEPNRGQSEEASVGNGPGGVRLTGLDKVDLGKNVKTQAERLVEA